MSEAVSNAGAPGDLGRAELSPSLDFTRGTALDEPSAMIPMHTGGRWGARVRGAALAVALLVLLPSSLFAQPRPAVPDNSLDRMNQAIDALTKKVWPSVVQIMVTGFGSR